MDSGKGVVVEPNATIMNQNDIIHVYEFKAAKGTILLASTKENKESEANPGFIR